MSEPKDSLTAKTAITDLFSADISVRRRVFLISVEEVRFFMDNGENRVAILAIIVSDSEAAEEVNGLLHEFGNYVVGRMGLPMRERGVNAITIVLDAPVNTVNALTGKLGKIGGVSAKALFGK